MTLREQLFALADPAYREFTRPLIPGVEHLIGVRVPQLRRLAREIARSATWRTWLDGAESLYHEERIVQGLVIGYARCTPDEKLHYLERFLPLIDNWAVCDICCWHLRDDERQPMWRFLQPRFTSRQEYEFRFAVVMSLGNFIDEEHLDTLLAHLDAARHEGYYARMGVAWALSVCYVRFPERTEAWLRRSTLDDWTYNKALQKIIESNRVDAATKQYIRTQKRRR